MSSCYGNFDYFIRTAKTSVLSTVTIVGLRLLFLSNLSKYSELKHQDVSLVIVLTWYCTMLDSIFDLINSLNLIKSL